MPSPAATKYFTDIRKALILRELANDKRLTSTSPRIEICRHAALAAQVATWNAYISNLVRNFFDVTADPVPSKFHALHNVAKYVADLILKNFNTPNFDLTRKVLKECTGYDTINDWSWTGYGYLQIQTRLNEILKVRHSFAHGFSIPTCSWTQSATGRIELTDQATRDNETFFENLVRKTDEGMKQHIIANYAIPLTW